MEGIGVLVLLAFAGIGTALYLHGKAKRRTTLGIAAQLLGGSANESASSATGALHGITTTFQLTSRGSGSNSESWTYIDCLLPQGYPLSLNLRRHAWLDSGKIERGELVNVQFDDAPFDTAFVVEGAPADVVRRMFDPDVRHWLVVTKSCDVTTQPGGLLRLAVRGWLETAEKMQPAMQVAAQLASGLRDATAAADRAVPVPLTDSPYRPIPDERPVRQAREARAAEVAALEATIKQRTDRQKQIAFVVIAAIISIMVISFASAFAR